MIGQHVNIQLTNDVVLLSLFGERHDAIDLLVVHVSGFNSGLNKFLEILRWFRQFEDLHDIVGRVLCQLVDHAANCRQLSVGQ